MKIEVGCYYRTRGGLKAFVGATCPLSFRPLERGATHVGWCRDGELWRSCEWGGDGMHCGSWLSDGEESAADLVSKWTSFTAKSVPSTRAVCVSSGCNSRNVLVAEEDVGAVIEALQAWKAEADG